MKQQVLKKIDQLELEKDELADKQKQIKAKFEDDVIKITCQKKQEIRLQGKIQQNIDEAEIKISDKNAAVINMRIELDRHNKRMMFKKLNYESALEEVEELKKEIARLENPTKTISTLRRTRTSYYKSNKTP